MLIVLVDHVLNYNVLSIIDGARYGYIRPSQKLGDKVSESVTTFSSDEVIANTIIKAVDKQEKVNALLQQKALTIG